MRYVRPVCSFEGLCERRTGIYFRQRQAEIFQVKLFCIRPQASGLKPNIEYCYGSSDKSVSRVLLPQCPGREHSGSHQLYCNDRRSITLALRITGHQNATGTRRSTQHEVTTNTELNGRRRRSVVLRRSRPLDIWPSIKA